MALPIFLQPLRLIPYYWSRVLQLLYHYGDWLKGYLTMYRHWLEESNRRVFGPLEQMVAAVVITTLAINGPPSSFFVDMTSPAVIATPAAGAPEPGLPKLPASSSTPNDTSIPNIGSTTFLSLPSAIVDPMLMGIIILLLSLNIVLLLIPFEIRDRLKTSWNIFWPPWQDRSTCLSSSTVAVADPEMSASTRMSSADPNGERDIPLTRVSAPSVERVSTPRPEPEAGTSRPDRPRPGPGSGSGSTRVSQEALKVSSGGKPREGQGGKPASSREPVTESEAARAIKESDGGRSKVAIASSESQKRALVVEEVRKTSGDSGPSGVIPSKETGRDRDGTGQSSRPSSRSTEDLTRERTSVPTTRTKTQSSNEAKPSEKSESEKARTVKREKDLGTVRGAGALKQKELSKGDNSQTRTRDPTIDGSAAARVKDDFKQRTTTAVAKESTEPSKVADPRTQRDRSSEAAEAAKRRSGDKERVRPDADDKDRSKQTKGERDVATEPRQKSGAKVRAEDPSSVAAPRDRESKSANAAGGGMRRAKRADDGLTPDGNAAGIDRDKGKSRMEGEQPNTKVEPPPLKSALKTSKTEQAPTPGGMEEPKEKVVEKPEEVISSTKGENAAGTTRTEGPAPTLESDPLMAGDFRPLKSAMKKSKKKPRQYKNIHHNYFMTMRGYRPHMIPFLHGYHPPPYGPRHSLWWKNVPKDMSHVMVPPPVPKEVGDVLDGESTEESGGE